MRKTVLVIVALCVLTKLHAQIELIKQKPETINGKGKIYALIIGISDYENIGDLNYADEDAQDFYDFLVKESELGVDSNNVRLLLNKNATSANVGKELLKLKNRMEEGSTFFFYFAGHGDANGEAQAFLLASDLPPVEDPSLYAFGGGVIHVYFIKDEIRKIIAEKKTNVILVTDACRTNELAGSKEGTKAYVNKIMEQNSGEIQFISCAADEKSEESDTWGQGRGVFSYFFMNGLRGLADNRPADGKVTVRELYDYVQRNVEEATVVTDEDIIAVTGKAFRQSPQYCCTEKQNSTLVLVNNAVKQNAIAKMAAAEHTIKLASSKGRSAIRTLQTNDSVLKDLYNKLYDALDSKQLVSPKGKSAWDYYTAFKNRAGKNSPYVFDATEDMKAALLNDAQITINAFYSYNDKWGMSDKTKRDFYEEGVEKLRKARSLMASDDPNSPIVKLTRQCMEAAGIFASNHPDDWKRGIKMMDSAITAFPTNPLPLFLKGRLLYNMASYDSALVYLRKSRSIAPRWSMPTIGISDVYSELGQYDSVEVMLTEVVEKNPVAIAYFKLGYHYGEHKEDYQNAVFYSKMAHTLAPEKTNIINNIGAYYEKQGEEDSALVYYEMAYSLDSNNAFTLCNIGKYHLEKGYYEKAEEALQRALKADSTEAVAHRSLGDLYLKKSDFYQYKLGQRLKFWNLSIASYEKAIKYKPTDKYLYSVKASAESVMDIALSEATMNRYLKYGKADADYYNEFGLIYLNNQDTVKALRTFKKGIDADSNFYYPYFNIGEIFYYGGQWDSALKYYEKASNINSSTNYLGYKIEKINDKIQEEMDRIELVATKERLLAIQADDINAALELADIYLSEGNNDSAYTLYLHVIEEDPLTLSGTFLSFFQSARYSYDHFIDTAMFFLAKAAQERKDLSLAYEYVNYVKDNSSYLYNDEAATCEKLYLACEPSQPDDYRLTDIAYNIALLFNYKGDTEKTLVWLEMSLEKGHWASSLSMDYNFDNLSENKPFNKLIKKYSKKQKKQAPVEDEYNWR
jgi:tetratricopeptide (TPR) repeat protein